MVRPERFELPASWFVARRSIQLSYGRHGAANTNTCNRNCHFYSGTRLAEREGFEPSKGF